MKSRVLALMAAGALAVGLPTLGVSSAVAKTKPPHAGQFCSPKKKPPKGFRCVKDKKGKFRLVKHK